MGLFSKKPKPPKAVGKQLQGDSHSTTSFHSDHDNIKSPIGANGRGFNRTSGVTGNNIPSTPMTAFHPRVDMPKPPDPNLDPAAYLRSLGAVRERSKIMTERALQNTLNHFEVDMSKFSDVSTFVCGIIKVSCLAVKCMIACYQAAPDAQRKSSALRAVCDKATVQCMNTADMLTAFYRETTMRHSPRFPHTAATSTSVLAAGIG